MDIINQINDKMKSNIDNFKDDVLNKSKREWIKSGFEVIKNLVLFVEELSKSYKESGAELTSEQKHQLVMDEVMNTLVSFVNEKVDIPLLNEEQEERLFKFTANAGIKAAVNFFKKNGWKL